MNQNIQAESLKQTTIRGFVSALQADKHRPLITWGDAPQQLSLLMDIIVRKGGAYNVTNQLHK